MLLWKYFPAEKGDMREILFDLYDIFEQQNPTKNLF